MKLGESKINIGIGPNKDKNHYKVYHVFKNGFSKDLKEKFKSQFDSKIFEGDLGQQFLLHESKTIYLGLGEKEKFSVRKLAAIYLKFGEQIIKQQNLGYEFNIPKDVSDCVDISSLIYHLSIALEIGAFPVDSLSKTYIERKFQVGLITFNVESGNDKLTKVLDKSKIVSRHINSSRFVEHLPSNYFTPEEFVSISKVIAKENKLKITIFDEARLQKEKLNGIISVGQGSYHEPKMIILEYNPSNPVTKKKLAIIGKGLTFDSGGISIKPSSEMHEMKYDMCGAAATIHAIGAIASLGLKIPIIAAIGVAENMPGGNAIKPGDVYTAYNGLTVEVQNTDAEGRLVLGDVLAYVCDKFKPDYMVDLATLTGAVLVALGNEAAGVMHNSNELMDKIKSASLTSEDRVWELPMWEEYAEDLKSDIADVRNITGGRYAGTITAAQFLQKFISKDVKWAHLDIAGTAWRSKASGTQCNGPTGYGIRLLVDLAEELMKGK